MNTVKHPLRFFLFLTASFLMNTMLFGQSGYSGITRSGVTVEQNDPGAEAAKEITRQRYDRARTLLAQAPESARICYLWGEFFLNNGQNDSAALYFRKGLGLDKNCWGCLIGLGQTLLGTNSAESEKLFTEAATLNKFKEEAQIQARIAHAYLSKPSPDITKVKFWLNSALTINEDEPLIYLVGGDLYVKQKKGNDAIATYQSALGSDPANVEAMHGTAVVYYQGRLYNRALESAGQALSTDPNHVPSCRLLMDIHFRNRDYPKAIEAFRGLERAGGVSTYYRAQFAASLFFEKDYAKALPEFDKLLTEEPNNPSVLRLKAYAHQYRGEQQQGVSVFERFFANADSSLIIDTDHQYYARLLMGSGKDSLAYIQFDKALSIAESGAGRTLLFKELLDSIQNRKQYEMADVCYRKYSGQGMELLTSQYHYWAENCFNAAFYRLQKGTHQDSIMFQTFAHRADSVGLILSTLAPTSYHGYYWQASAKSLFDTKFEIMDAKPLYEQVLTFETLPNKPRLAAYKYLGAYYVLSDLPAEGLSFYEKYLTINPSDPEISGYAESLRAALKTQK